MDNERKKRVDEVTTAKGGKMMYDYKELHSLTKCCSYFNLFGIFGLILFTRSLEPMIAFICFSINLSLSAMFDWWMEYFLVKYPYLDSEESMDISDTRKDKLLRVYGYFEFIWKIIFMIGLSYISCHLGF
jgi:hypothetical protein